MGCPSTQIKRETQLKHLAINSFISMSHKQCYRRCQAVAVAASVEVEEKVEAADWRALRLHYTLLQLLRSNFMSFLGTKSYKTARNCQPFEERLLCSALLYVDAVFRGDNCVLRLLLFLHDKRTDLCLPSLGLG